MTEDQQWTKLFRYLDDRFKAIDQRFEAVDRRFDRQDSVIDSIYKHLGDHDVEHAAMNAQLDRHEVAIDRLAAQSGLELSK